MKTSIGKRRFTLNKAIGNKQPAANGGPNTAPTYSLYNYGMPDLYPVTLVNPQLVI